MSQTDVKPNGLPDYLQAYDALEQHFRAQLEGQSTSVKGRRFAQFSQRLLPQTELGSRFELPRLASKESDDEGVDLSSQGRDGSSVLYIQSRLWIDRADDIDSIMSKFQSYLSTHHLETSQQYELALNTDSVHFCIVTLSPLAGILRKYRAKNYASKAFFNDIESQKRLTIIDGANILDILKAAFTKLAQLPSSLKLKLESAPVRKDNVFIGIISSTQLKQLYAELGDSLFFENIRDFLDVPTTQERPGRTTPNAEIVKTVVSNPEKLIARNNGIVFRADVVTPGDSEAELTLTRGSIVNGCQTTMCVVQHAQSICYVPIKIVQTEDSWDIAKAANYQNSVFDIDLDLARNLRPQLVKRAASMAGVKIDRGVHESAFQIIETIYAGKVAYNETRLLFIGLFSRSPNNVFAANYTELSQDLIDRFYADDQYGERTFEVLFALQAACQLGLQEARTVFEHPSYASSFDRLYSDSSLPYRCFIGILALSGAVNVSIADRKSDPLEEFARMKDYFAKALELLQQLPDKFQRYYLLAAKIWMSDIMQSTDETTLRRDMSLESRRVSFSTLFRRLCLESDLDTRMREGDRVTS